MEFSYILGILFISYIIWTIIELICLHKFNLKSFNYGVKVFEKDLNFKHINWDNLDEFYTEKLAEYVFIQEYRIGYFVSNLSFYQYYSPLASSRGMSLTIFGKIEEVEKKLRISFYISYRLIALLILFLALSIFILIVTFSLITALVIFGSWGGLFLAYKIISVFQQGKMLTMVDEIKSILRV